MIGGVDVLAVLRAVLVMVLALAICAIPVGLLGAAIARNSVGLALLALVAGAIVLGLFGWFLSLIDLSH